MATIRIILADDHTVLRTGLRLLIDNQPDFTVVGEAADGQAALDELARLDGECDVVLMDVRMPRLNGIDATSRVVVEYPQVRVLVLTTFDMDEYAHAAIRAGASGFLLKDARPTELMDAIQRVAAGDAVMAPSMMKRMLVEMREGGDAVVQETVPAPNNEAVAALTDREREVLCLIAEGLNNQEISEKLFLSESTVKTHVGRILFKLDLRDRIHAVIFAKEHGL